jgi:hypothetical protein
MLAIIITGILIVLIIMKLVSIHEARSAAKANALCHRCANVHRVKGVGGKELLFCNFGGELRAIGFAVCECTGFRSNEAPTPVRVAGFVRLDELEKKEAFPAVAIRISRE